MRLYLVQHGQAKSEEEDPERPLTGQGASDVVAVATLAIERYRVHPSRIVHSGKLRAQQTAETWGGLLGVTVEVVDGLAPTDDPAAWAERLDAATDDLMLVGHLPHLDRFAGSLLRAGTGASGADDSMIRFRPGGLVGLERGDAGWLVSVVLPPPG